MALVCIIILSTCSKEQTKTYKGDVSSKYVPTSITYRDDKVLRQPTINTTKHDDLGMDKDGAKELFAKSESIFRDLKSVKYRADYKDKEAIEHLDIDHTGVDMKKLNKRLDISTKENEDISFEGLEEQLRHRGLKGRDKMDDK